MLLYTILLHNNSEGKKGGYLVVFTATDLFFVRQGCNVTSIWIQSTVYVHCPPQNKMSLTVDTEIIKHMIMYDKSHSI